MDPTRPARLRHAQDAVAAAQRRLDLARREVDETKGAYLAAVQECLDAKALRDGAKAAEAAVFAERDGSEVNERGS